MIEQQQDRGSGMRSVHEHQGLGKEHEHQDIYNCGDHPRTTIKYSASQVLGDSEDNDDAATVLLLISERSATGWCEASQNP